MAGPDTSNINALLARGIGPAMLEGAHAGYFNSKTQQEAANEQRRLAAQQYIPAAMQGDPTAQGQLAASDPKTFEILSVGQQHNQAMARQKHLDSVEWTGRWANALLGTAPAEREQAWQLMRQEGQKFGYDLSKTPEHYDPSLDPQLRTHRAVSSEYVKQQRALELKRTSSKQGGAAGPVFDPLFPGHKPTPVPVEPSGGGAADKESSLVPPMPTTQVAEAGPVSVSGSNTATLASQGTPAEPAAEPAGMPEGFQAMGHRDPQGRLVPALINGQPVFRNPQTGEMRLGGSPQVAQAAPAEPVPAQSSGGTNAQGPGGGLPPAGPQMAQNAQAPKTVAPVSSAPEAEVNEVPPGFKVRTVGGIPFKDKAGLYQVINEAGKVLWLRPKTEKAASPTAALDIDKNLKGEEVFAALPPADAAEIKSIIKGDNPIPSPQARTERAQKIRNLVFQAAGEGFTDVTHATRMKTRLSLASSQQGSFGSILTSQGQLFNHMAEGIKTADELNNNPYPLLNKGLNALGMAQGDPRPSNLKVTTNRINGELDRFFTGGVPTVSGLAEARDELNNWTSPDQFIQAVGKLTKLVKGRQVELAHQINRGLGYKKDDPNYFDIETDMTPETKSNWDYIESRFRASKEHSDQKYGGAPAASAGGKPPLDSFQR